MAEVWNKPTAVDLAATFVIGALAPGPMSAPALQQVALVAGHSRTSLARAKYRLRAAGTIDVRRIGARTNPYTISLLEPPGGQT